MPKTVMLLEDTVSHQKLFTAWLEAGGYQVHVVGDARLAYVEASRRQPSVVVADVRLPHLDGREVMRQLRSSEVTRHIPILALTVLSERADERACYQAGADAFVNKSVRGPGLLKIIDGLLAGERRAPA